MPGTANHLPSSIVHPRRILVRGVNWLGDAVMSTPALQRLREAHPQAHLTLLTHEKLKDLWLHHPGIDAVLTFASDENLWPVARRLRGEKFQLAVVLPNSPRSALEVWLAGIPQRIGYAGPWRNWLLTQKVARRAGYVRMQRRSVAEINRLNHHPIVSQPSTINAHLSSVHHIHHYLHLVAAAGASPEPVAPRLAVAAEEVAALAERFGLARQGLHRWPACGICPGAEYGPAKRWPEERFIETAIELQRRVGCRWLIFGGQSEAELAARMAKEIEYEAGRPPSFGRLPPDPAAVNLAGRTSLRELCAALSLCRVLLTNDTGPMHVAAALGTPVVVPFGSTSSELTGPGLPGDTRHRLLKSDAPCAPCFRRTCPIDFRCMNGIGTERVVEAVVEILRQPARCG